MKFAALRAGFTRIASSEFTRVVHRVQEIVHKNIKYRGGGWDNLTFGPVGQLSRDLRAKTAVRQAISAVIVSRSLLGNLDFELIGLGGVA